MKIETGRRAIRGVSAILLRSGIYILGICENLMIMTLVLHLARII